MTPSTRGHFGGLGGQFDERDEAIRLAFCLREAACKQVTRARQLEHTRFRKPREGKAVRSKALQSGEPAGVRSWLSLAVIRCGHGRWRT